MHCGVMKTDEKLLITLTLLDVISSSRLHCRCTAFSYLEKDPELSFFGVYDGHGGAKIAAHVSKNLHKHILRQPEYKQGAFEAALTKVKTNVTAQQILPSLL